MIEVDDKRNCTGCTACKSICPRDAITMVSDNEGFLYPLLNHGLCVNCGLCDKVCPLPKRDNQDNACSCLDAYVAHYCNNDDIWYESASGGVFTAITNYVLENDGVVYGAAYNKEWEVEHSSASSISDAVKFRGSKYVQSKLNDTFREIKSNLLSGQLVLFSGTPCQVAGLKSYLKKDYQNLITVDLLCHCVPSPRIFKDYINYIQNRYKKKISKINMKDKTLGWNSFQTPRIYFEDGTSIFNIEDTKLWETIFYSHIAVRPSCYSCRFSNLNRVGDFTIGDYWGVEKFHPEFCVPNGASILLINSRKGQEAFRSFSNYLKYEITDPIKGLPSSLVYAVSPHPKRSQFWLDYEAMSFTQICKSYFGLGLLNDIKRRSASFIYSIKKLSRQDRYI